jgi:uncharacterized protein
MTVGIAAAAMNRAPPSLLHCKTYNFSPRVPARPSSEHTLKFQPDQLAGTNVVTRQGEGELWIGAARFNSSVLLPWTGTVLPWQPSKPEDLSAADFEAVLALKPELVIFGSGARIKFVDPGLMRCLIDRRIGVETMDTAAACRTFNVLVTEGRCAVAALLVSGRSSG